ncbi:class I SAM-dependent methyltransferase [Roseofilum sp. Guam]|uniref:class I SAM-dependent methyltransferase n=1 Tax=Roseofilum sp. Guam TaxID=2821502 RepID=UPI0039A1CC49
MLREKYGDRVIADAINSGCRQLLLLESGYDTRFFRIASIQEKDVTTHIPHDKPISASPAQSS